jgi:uncharacterized membrane protein
MAEASKESVRLSHLIAPGRVSELVASGRPGAMRWHELSLLVFAAFLVLPWAVGASAHRNQSAAATPSEAVAPGAARNAGQAHVEHASDAGGHRGRHRELRGVPKLLAWLGNFHPSTVHFPIALLITAALAELLALVRTLRVLREGARLCLWAAALTALPAACLGWLFGGFALVDEDWILTAHRWLGTSTAAWAVVALVLGERARRSGRGRSVYLAALLTGAGLVSATGFFGGALVYGLDHYAW